MIISRIILNNWKNFQNADIELSERVFIVGANASGKSNFLDSIRFLRDIVKQSGGLQHAVEVRGGVSKIRCLSARRQTEVAIEIHLKKTVNDVEPEWKYRIRFRHTGGGIFKSQAVVVEEKVWNRTGNAFILDRNADSNDEDSETLKFTHLEQVTANKDFRDIFLFLQDTQYLHIVPQLIRDSDSYVLASNKEDFYGRNLLEKISKTNQKTRNSYLNKINEVLRIAVPQLENLTFIKDKKTGIPHFEARYNHWRASGAKQQEEQFSDGTLRLIGFMWALLDGNSTILLEEPELYLNTAIIKQLPEFISRFQRRKERIRQVLISTHSYDLLDSHTIGSDEIVVLQVNNEGSEINIATEVEDVKDYLESGFSAADAVLPKVSPKNIENMINVSEK